MLMLCLIRSCVMTSHKPSSFVMAAAATAKAMTILLVPPYSVRGRLRRAPPAAPPRRAGARRPRWRPSAYRRAFRRRACRASRTACPPAFFWATRAWRCRRASMSSSLHEGRMSRRRRRRPGGRSAWAPSLLLLWRCRLFFFLRRAAVAAALPGVGVSARRLLPRHRYVRRFWPCLGASSSTASAFSTCMAYALLACREDAARRRSSSYRAPCARLPARMFDSGGMAGRDRRHDDINPGVMGGRRSVRSAAFLRYSPALQRGHQQR